ncbi:MAG TPA: DUF309 domain-containing protein [Holophagaceae bacterium]|jgi:predicted metal-dependent hydrolase|nr:DUF309 domain-containing protein [Holophagaceae bacterium]
MSIHHLETPFFQRQPVLPLPIQRFLRKRIEAALHDPSRRFHLAWPTVLGAPRLRELYPDGVPEAELFAHAAKMLAALGIADPAAAWGETLAAFPDTAEQGATGWMPTAEWGAFGPLISLRSGWQLMALTPLPPDEIYDLSCGVSFFNHGLYHECHDALEPLWIEADGPLKGALQGFILMTAGYHHLQLQNANGMKAVWEESLARLEPFHGRVETPWGHMDFAEAAEVTRERLTLLAHESDWPALWRLDRPLWTLEA